MYTNAAALTSAVRFNDAVFISVRGDAKAEA
jgi:hypothetical protein